MRDPSFCRTFHSIDENIAIVNGNWFLGTGRRFSRSALEPLELGTFGIVPKDRAHFGWSKTETIVQVHGIGPFSSTAVDSVYELTDKGVFLLTSLLSPDTPTSSSPPNSFALRIGAHLLTCQSAQSVLGSKTERRAILGHVTGIEATVTDRYRYDVRAGWA